MPPIRTTPAKVRYNFKIEPEEQNVDYGFNPAWAKQPEPVSIFPEDPAQESPVKLPAQTVVQQFATNTRLYNKKVDNDGVSWGILLPLALIYNAAKGITGVATSAAKIGYQGANLAATAVRKAWLPERHNPISTRGRRLRTPVKKALQEDSLLKLPPHMVGMTPNVVRRARGQKPRGEKVDRTPTIEEAKDWELFHATPLSKKPKAPLETPLTTGASGTPWKTPQFEFNTPSTKLQIGKSKEFAMNIHKTEFKDWLKLLKKNGLGTTALKKDITEKFTLPTAMILHLHKLAEKGKTQGFEALVKCFTHEGFTTHYKIAPPTISYPAPAKFREGEVKGVDINSVRQQADGCCKFCRGFSWAGQVETREISEGEEVPCKSQHKSVVPYTKKEQAEFDQNKYDLLFSRWCYESRYDWIFETPKTSGWEIPKDDPRLRHISMIKQQHKATYGAPKLYDGDLMADYNKLRMEYTNQDIAAKVLIDAIREVNPQLASQYAKMDLERKRRQVKTEWLCVRQVEVVIKNQSSPTAAASTTSSNNLAKRTKRTEAEHETSPPKTAKRVKFAAEPAGPTTNGQKTPAKGILKSTTSSANKTGKTPLSRKKVPVQKSKGFFHDRRPPPAPYVRDENDENAANPKLDLNNAPSLAPSGSEQTFFFGASARKPPSSSFGQLPPSFDPISIRKEYNSGVAKAEEFWNDPHPFGWKPDPTLTKEENDAERFNFVLEKINERQEMEKKLREMELEEEKARKEKEAKEKAKNQVPAQAPTQPPAPPQFSWIGM